jgi:hypothetical protein
MPQAMGAMMVQFTLKSLRRCPVLRDITPQHQAAEATTPEELRRERSALLAEQAVAALRWMNQQRDDGVSVKLWAQQQRKHKQPPPAD